MSFNTKRKILLISYMSLIILTFLPENLNFLSGFNPGDSLIEFLFPIFLFNIIFWLLYAMLVEDDPKNNDAENKVWRSLGLVFIHLPIMIILDIIPSPLNALVFGLFSILVIAFS